MSIFIQPYIHLFIPFYQSFIYIIYFMYMYTKYIIN